VLDKRGACYRQSPTPSTENLKKFSEIKELQEKPRRAPLPATPHMRE